jgi:hypothetical protein
VRVESLAISRDRAETKRNHEIDQLATTAELIGLRTVNRPLLKRVQCSPSVRYQSSLVSKDEALTAHRASIAISADIASSCRSLVGTPAFLVAPC